MFKLLHILLSIPILQNHRAHSVFCCSGDSDSQPDLHRPTHALFFLWNEYREVSQVNQNIQHTRGGVKKSQRGNGWGAQTSEERGRVGGAKVRLTRPHTHISQSWKYYSRSDKWERGKE
ncbi:MAG: hypothetical protein JOS17DRAFT_595087 [Linnemannia elongata]|nr:MAG: hypothetical protein JOS17DRAFT_595087 [Linnemannia elongata]